MQKIKNETGYNISKQEFLILAGYIFVDEGELFVRRDQARKKTISYSNSALANAAKVSYSESVEFITCLQEKWKSEQQNPSKYGTIEIIVKGHKFTGTDGENELNKEELLTLVKKVKSEIERIEAINKSKKVQGNQEEQR